MMTTDEMIAVLQAHKEGKEIQVRLANDSDFAWVHHCADTWNFAKYDYRVAPESHLLKGYCFARDIHETPVLGMVKVEQVHFTEGENPLPRKPRPRKPREWILCDGTDHDAWIVVGDAHLRNRHCSGERVRVREVIE